MESGNGVLCRTGRVVEANIDLGGNPHSAMAAMPLREWTRRLGALQLHPYGFNRIQAWFARLIAANGKLPSDPSHEPTIRLLAACRVLASVKDKPSAALKKPRP